MMETTTLNHVATLDTNFVETSLEHLVEAKGLSTLACLDVLEHDTSLCSSVATPGETESSLKGSFSPVSTASAGSEPSAAVSTSAAAVAAARAAVLRGDVDAKSSALKALAGIGRVVSRSRQIDAEALQAIKLQRAKARAEGSSCGSINLHRHSRTLSSDSVAELATSSLSLAGGAGTGGGGSSAHGSIGGSSDRGNAAGPSSRPRHRRSHSAFHPSTAQASLPLTSPGAYTEFLAGRSLAELQALQKAVDAEIARHLSGAGRGNSATSCRGSMTPPLPASDAALSAHYAAALVAAQQQREQQEQAATLQQALLALSRFGQTNQNAHLQQTQSNTSPYGSDSGMLAAASANLMFSGQLDTTTSNGLGLGGAGGLGENITSPVDISSSGNHNNGAMFSDNRATSPYAGTTPDFSFLNDFQPRYDAQSQSQQQHRSGGGGGGGGLISGGLLPPPSPPHSHNNVFSRSTASLPPRPHHNAYKHNVSSGAHGGVGANGGVNQTHHARGNSDTSSTSQLPSLFAGLHLSGGTTSPLPVGSPLNGLSGGGPNPWF